MKTTAMYKKCLLLLYAVVLAAALTCGLLAVQAPTAARAEEPAPTTERAFYYVDAGNLVTTEGGTTHAVGRNNTGYPSAVQTTFMQTYDLEFGDADGNGLYNSVTDREFYQRGDGDKYTDTTVIPDSVTGKEWGSYTKSWENNRGYSWSYWRYGDTSSTNNRYDGYKTSRHTNESNGNKDGVLYYKFEVPANVNLKVEMGARAYWDTRTYPYWINDLTPVTIEAPNNSDKSYLSTELWPGQTIQGVEESNGKSYITLAVGEENTESTAYVSWILISTENYELPVGYTITDTFVKKGATTLTVEASDGSPDQQAAIMQESLTAIGNAAYFDVVNVGVTVNGKTCTQNLTVLPESTKYFVNCGGSAIGELLRADAEYTTAAGYGYIREGSKAHSGKQYPGGAEWKTDSYQMSCRLDMDILNYRFDVPQGHYGVVLGVVEHWPVSDNRPHELTVNGGTPVTVLASSVKDGFTRGTAYGDVSTDGQMTVKIEAKGKEAIIISYILVYEVNKITYDSQGGSEVNGKYFEKGATADVATAKPERDAYEFAGWFAAADGEQEVTTVNANTTVYAHWIACEYDNGSVEWQWNGITSATVVMPCMHANCNQSRTETGTITSEVTEAATCTSGGTITYTATVTIGSTPFTDTKTAPGTPLGHLYGEPKETDWTWNRATHAAEVSLTCSRDDCDHSVTKTAEISSSSTGATCTEGGTVTYTATVQVSETNQTFTDTETEQGTPNGHAYGAPQAADWTWDETAYTATVTLTCPNCEDGTEGHTHDETATVTSTSTATCTQEGTKTYTAKITVNGMEYTNAKSVEDAALGHNGVQKAGTAATCTEHGTVEHYECDRCHLAFGDAECTEPMSEDDVNGVAALGHAYNTTQLVWNWSGYAGATVHVTCTRCDHDEDVAATVTNSVTKEATATEDGERTYTATVTVNGQPHTDTKTETILKTGTVPTPGPAYEPLEESGCGSSMTGAASIGGCVTCLALAACLLRRKKTA